MEGNVQYEEYAIALSDGKSELLWGPFRSIDYCRECLADMKSRDEYKDKKLYIVKHVVSPWEPY